MQSFLIVGGGLESRLSEAEKIIGQPVEKLENNPDFILLTSLETSIGIDQVRQMQKNISLKPFIEKQKYCLITEAQDLTPEAQNSLLKTLEEPPPHCLIILTANNESSLLPTVVSRCLVVRLNNETNLIKQEEKESLLNLFTELLSSSPGKRLVLFDKQEMVKNKQSSMIWLEKLTFVLREKMLEENEKGNDFLPILRLINQARYQLTLNANVRLVMENFLLDLPLINL